jgi:actin-related protein 6
MSDIVILDSGAHSIKIGFGTDTGPKLFPNAIYRAKNSSRLLISDEIKSYRDKSSLFYLYPHDNGYTLNWDVQRTVWEHIIHDKVKITIKLTGRICVLLIENFCDL